MSGSRSDGTLCSPLMALLGLVVSGCTMTLLDPPPCEENEDTVDTTDTADTGVDETDTPVETAETGDTEAPSYLEPDYWWVTLAYGSQEYSTMSVMVKGEWTPPIMLIHLASKAWFESGDETQLCEMATQFTAEVPTGSEGMQWDILSFDDAHSGTCVLDPAVWGEDPVDVVLGHSWGWYLDMPDGAARTAAAESLGEAYSELEYSILGGWLMLDGFLLSYVPEQGLWGYAEFVSSGELSHDPGPPVDAYDYLAGTPDSDDYLRLWSHELRAVHELLE